MPKRACCGRAPYAAERDSVAQLQIEGASLEFDVRGTGPSLLVPVCNFPWLDMPFMDVLAARFTVVTASPRGYQASTRFSEEQSYGGEMFVADLLAICDHVGLDTFAVLGYSLTAAMAAWLARMSPRVEAVVAGGFPLLGSYEQVLRGAERDVHALLADDDAAAPIKADFDVRAVLTFYRELAGLSDGALVTDVGCPMFAFWGTADEILWSFNVASDFAHALADRGIATHAVDGGDHAGTILRFDEVVGDVIDWLAAHGRRSSQT
jgi:pimeloyl-ACP methyl ester carboxylesterase